MTTRTVGPELAKEVAKFPKRVQQTVESDDRSPLRQMHRWEAAETDSPVRYEGSAKAPIR